MTNTISSAQEEILRRHINRLRGVFSNRNSFKKHRINEQWKDFRLGTRKCFLAARAELLPSQFNKYLSWYFYQLNAFGKMGEPEIGFDYFNGLLTSKPLSLSREMLWIKERVILERDVIQQFRNVANQIDSAVCQERYGEALQKLSELVATFGESMWSVQLRLGIEQCSGGIEAQKKYYEHVKAQYKNSLLSFVSQQTSTRNEDRTSLRRFQNFISEKIEKKFNADMVSYLNYRLFNEWPNSEVEISDILRIEQSHSIIDIYETFISFTQELIKNQNLSYLKPLVLPILAEWQEIGDFRITKLLYALSDNATLKSLPKRDNKFACAIIRTQNREAISLLRKHKNASTDPWLLIYQAFLLAHFSLKRSNRVNVIVYYLAKVLRRSKSCEHDIEALKKRLLNLVHLSSNKAVSDFLETISPSGDLQPFRFFIVGLNSQLVGFEDFGLSSSSDQLICDLYEDELETPLAQFWRAQVYNVTTSGISILSASAYSKALRLTREGDFVGCVNSIGNHYKKINRASNLALVKSDSSVLSEMCMTLLINANIELSEHQKVISLMAEGISENPACRALLPVKRGLSNLDNSVYKSVQQPLSSLIAMHALWRETESSKTLSSLRFATDRFLRSVGNVKPSELIEHSINYPTTKLIYFLRHVCQTYIIDISDLFPSSRDVLIERQEICGVLNDLDPENDIEYQGESLYISHALKVADGVQIINRNRVHVDVEALGRWAEKSILDDYKRYQDLAKLSSQPERPYEEVLNEALNYKENPHAFFIPDDETDFVLIELMDAIKEEFLNNSKYGLDYFLGGRVRHQSFSNLLRSPLEKSKVITTRATEYSGYNPNHFWLSKFTTLSTDAREAVSDCFANFAKNFDDLMSRIKDDLFQVRSKDHPRGFFSIVISKPMLIIARTVAKDLDLEEFLPNLYMMFWGALEPGLREAREFIGANLREEITRNIVALREGIRQHAEHDPAFMALNSALTSTSIEIQEALSESQAWFLAPQVQQATHRFSLMEALEISVESVLKLNRSFTPNLKLEVDGEVELVGASLVFITDVILVAFSNIKAYAMQDNPDVRVRVVASKDLGTLSIEVLNDCSSRARSEKQDEKLEALRRVIDQRQFDVRSKKEGSGFLRLATTIQQSSKGVLEFGYVEKRTFRLFVSYYLISEQSPKLEAA